MRSLLSIPLLLLLPALTHAQFPLDLTGCVGDCVNNSAPPSCAVLDFACWCRGPFLINVEKCAIDTCALAAPRDLLYVLEQFCDAAGAPIPSSIIPTSWYAQPSDAPAEFSTTGYTTYTITLPGGGSTTTLTVPLIAGGGANPTSSGTGTATEATVTTTKTTKTTGATASSTTTTLQPARTIVVVPGVNGTSETSSTSSPSGVSTVSGNWAARATGVSMMGAVAGVLGAVLVL